MATRVEPTSHEHFQQAGLSDVEALVRELIQNGSDRPDDRTAHVTLRLVRTTMRELEPLLGSLWPHVEASHGGSSSTASEDDVISLIGSDDNVGLEGDPTSTSWDNEPDDRWGGLLRTSGESPKTGESGGSTGNGKETYRHMSGFSCFLVMTRRASEVDEGIDRLLLSGAATLRHHELADRRYLPYGRLVRPGGPIGIEPIEEPATIAALMHPLGVQREFDEPGTDVVIPHLPGDVDAEALIDATCRHFFPTLISGDLVVTVEDTDGTSTVIDSGTLLEVIRDHAENPDDLIGDVALYEAGLERARTESVRTIPAGDDGLPDFGAVAEDERTVWRDRLRAGEVLAFELTFRVTNEGGVDEEGGVHVILREEERRRGRPHYQRGPLSICGVQTNRHLTPGHRAIVDVREGVVARACRLSEPPAHTDWRQTRPEYKAAGFPKSLIIAVKRAAATTLSAILGEDDGVETSAAEAFFSVAEEEPRPGGDPGGEGPGPEPPPVPPVPPSSRGVRISRLASGFTVTLADPSVEAVSVRAGYSVRRGDPFKKHLPADFSFLDGPVDVSLDGGTYQERDHNMAVIRVDDAEHFRFRVSGFDTNRSLSVKADAEELA